MSLAAAAATARVRETVRPYTWAIASAEAWVRAAHERPPYSLAPGISAVISSAGSEHTFGVGVQEHGASAPADGDTLYEIGSLSKTMVALALATLVTSSNGSGNFEWHDPVRRWLGDDFKLGSEGYVSSTLTVSDLLAHRSGLAEGQGDLLGYFFATDEYTKRLADVDPVHTLRSTFDYSNTGWTLAGQVLRRATNASSWCAALHATLLGPLNLTRTYCHRNEIPSSVASARLAAVHKADPCRTAAGAAAPAVATYDFVSTGGPADFGWGAADAAGSVISSAADMGRVIALLLGSASSPVLSRAALQTMQSGQMVTPPSWLQGCGVPGWDVHMDPSARPAGRAASHAPRAHASALRRYLALAHSTLLRRQAAAGFGFDLVTELRLGGRDEPYAEKNGDTDMHKARLGLLPAAGQGVLLLSNLGGSMGGPLTALKFGVLAILAGGTADDADAAAAVALNTTGFWSEQWAPETTCTPCGRSGASGACMPGGRSAPPLPASAFVGAYGTAAYGPSLLTLGAAADGGLLLSVGPVASAPLSFSNTSMYLEQPCKQLGATLELFLEVWSLGAARRVAALLGTCSLAEFVLPPEIPAAGVSASGGTVAFPWGCGPVPLPDGPSIYVVSHDGRGVLAVLMGEALEVA